jgi:TrmH family RNA methyltransferase
MSNPITSLQNPLVKSIVRLQQKASERRATGSFAIEGRREISLARQNNIEVEKLFICPEIFRPDPIYPIIFEAIDTSKLFEVSLAVYNKIAYREGVEGVIMLGRAPEAKLRAYNPGQNSLMVVLEGVEKPGNLGAILRTTDAAGVDAVLLCNMRTDLFNPNSIRASMGCVFSQKIFVCESTEAINWLKEKGIDLYATAPESSHFYTDVNLTKPTAIAFGAEDDGLSQLWLKQARQVIKIPMNGVIDSLNVSASVAIIAFEAIRQRSSDL